jgi:large subunit ribosomal protein L9
LISENWPKIPKQQTLDTSVFYITDEDKKMEVILKKTIDTLGREGEVVNVKPGYARNYLIPQNMATLVNKAALARLQKEQDSIAKRHDKEKQAADALAAQLEKLEVKIERRVGSEERLFGSVTTTDIAEKIAELGVTIDRRTIVLADPIKSLGEFPITIKIGYQMTTEVALQVVPKAAAEEE